MCAVPAPSLGWACAARVDLAGRRVLENAPHVLNVVAYHYAINYAILLIRVTIHSALGGVFSDF